MKLPVIDLGYLPTRDFKFSENMTFVLDFYKYPKQQYTPPQPRLPHATIKSNSDQPVASVSGVLEQENTKSKTEPAGSVWTILFDQKVASVWGYQKSTKSKQNQPVATVSGVLEQEDTKSKTEPAGSVWTILFDQKVASVWGYQKSTKSKQNQPVASVSVNFNQKGINSKRDPPVASVTCIFNQEDPKSEREQPAVSVWVTINKKGAKSEKDLSVESLSEFPKGTKSNKKSEKRNQPVASVSGVFDQEDTKSEREQPAASVLGSIDENGAKSENQPAESVSEFPKCTKSKKIPKRRNQPVSGILDVEDTKSKKQLPVASVSCVFDQEDTKSKREQPAASVSDFYEKKGIQSKRDPPVASASGKLNQRDTKAKSNKGIAYVSQERTKSKYNQPNRSVSSFSKQKDNISERNQQASFNDPRGPLVGQRFFVQNGDSRRVTAESSTPAKVFQLNVAAD